MLIRHIAVGISLLLPAAGAAQAPDTAHAIRVFGVARGLVDQDGGRLWGRSLDSPLLLVARSRELVANAADGDGILAAAGSIWTGTLPARHNPANSSLEWAGRHWTMLTWPVPADSFALRALLAHELWHRAQASLGLPARDPPNGHLALEDGRVWLRLEARALARALGATGAASREAALDALRFRAARHARYPGSDTSESAVELHEGLAQYTGTMLSGRSPAAALADEAQRLRQMESETSVVRSFAYYTGPAYGLLLDRWRPGWRADAPGAASLTGLLAERLGTPPPARSADAAASRYGAGVVRAEERERSERRAARQRELTARLVTGPALRLPLASMQMGFDPGRVEPLDAQGTVYGGMRLSDDWGVLDAGDGETLVNPAFTEAAVGVGQDFDVASPSGPGWALTLNPGWRVVADRDRGGWLVTKDGR